MRRTAIAARLALPTDVHARQSAAMVDHLLSTFEVAGAVVAFCWPHQAEPDIRAAVDPWRAKGCRVALPVVVGKGLPLVFREWQANAPLVEDRYGIPTPAEGESLRPEWLFLPVNAFDARGYRLGYGGGYFDRTLAGIEPRPTVVGIGFESARVESIRPEAHDQPLDWMVTEAGVWRFPRP